MTDEAATSPGRMRDGSPGDASVAVIIPTFNRAHILGDAVQSAIGQATPGLDVQVIVVDDGSTDGTREEANKWGASVTYVRQDNHGPGTARNRGMDCSHSAWIKFLDSDDVLMPGRLAREVREGNSSAADIVVSGWTGGGLEDSVTDVVFEAPVFRSIPDDVVAGVAVPTSSALYRAESLRGLRWHVGLKKLDDWDFFCQAALKAGRIATCPGSAYKMREHGGPRLTQASLLANAHEHHAILRRIESALAGARLLSEPRRLRLAQYFYKELRVLALYDRGAFEDACVDIVRLDPKFTPRDEEQSVLMRLAGRLLGFRRSTLLHCAAKRTVAPWRVKGVTRSS